MSDKKRTQAKADDYQSEIEKEIVNSIERRRTVIDEIKNQDDNFRTEHTQLRHENFSIQDKIGERDQEILRMREEIFIWRQKVSAKKLKTEDRKRELDALNIQNDRLNGDLTEVTNLLNEEKKTNSKVKTDFNTTEGQVNRLHTDIENGRDNVVQLEGDIAASRQTQVKIDNDILAAKRRIIEIDDKTLFLTDKKHTYTAEIGRVDGSTLNLKDLVSRYRSDRAQFDKARADEDARIKSLQDQVTTMEGNIREDIKTIDQLESEKQEVNRNIIYVESKLSANQTHLNGVKDRASVLESDHEVLKRDIELLPRDLRKEEVDLKRSEDE